MTGLIAWVVAAAMLSSCTPHSAGLDGKSIAVIGDSISYGTNYEGGYGKILGEQENMNVTNASRGGAAVARGVKWSSDGEGVRPSIIDMAEELDGEYDFIIAEGGINDFWNHTPVGSLTEGFDGVYDDTSFAGGMEAMFYSIKQKHPESKAGFVIIHDPFTYDAEEAFEPYYAMMKDACEKWEVPYLDLYSANNQSSGVNVRDAEQRKLYFASEERPEGDGTHPNETGYRIIYAEPMANWLLDMLK